MGTVTKLKKEKGMSFAEALKTAKVDESVPAAKSKSKVPLLDPPPEVQEAIDQLVPAKKAEKEAKATIAQNESVIMPWIADHQDSEGFKGKFRTSYKLAGKKEQVTYVTQNRYSITSGDEGEIMEILGKDAYAELLLEKPILTVKEEIFENEELQQALVDLVGERFADFFEFKAKLTVVDGFNAAVYKYVDSEKLTDLRVFVRPYKASLRG